jgi:hypothetical protein
MPIHTGSSPWQTSETDAVNTLLATIGSQPVNSVDAPSVDAAMAKNTLKEISLAVQMDGWYFNTDQKKVWSPDSSGIIYLPSSVMQVDNSYGDSDDRKVVVRPNPSYNNRICLYDVTYGTFVFTRPITTKTVYAYGWESLPQPARHYITIRAARVFQDRMVGSERHHSFTLRDEQYALLSLRRYESEVADHSIFDDYSVYRVIDRVYPYMTGQ